MPNWADIFDAVKKHAEETPQIECCGLILADGTVVRSENILEPEQHRPFRYQLEQQHSDRILQDWDSVLGIYHSLVNGRATPGVGFTHPVLGGKLYVIAGMDGAGAVTEIRAYHAVVSSVGCRLVQAEIEPLVVVAPVNETREQLRNAPEVERVTGPIAIQVG